MFGRKPYDRQKTLAAAEKARQRGRTKKAISEYRKVLKKTPDDHVTHGKLAPLLAQRRETAEAQASFERAAQGYIKEGRDDRAIAMYLVATQHFPKDEKLWERVARLQVERGKRADAVRTFLQARGHFRSRGERDLAIWLLEKALALDAKNVEASIDLARLLSKQRRKEHAARILEVLLIWVRGEARRKVRRAQFWLAPSPGAAWRWLRGA